MLDLEKTAKDAAKTAEKRKQGTPLKHLASEVVEAAEAKALFDEGGCISDLNAYCSELADCIICALSAFGEIEERKPIETYIAEKMQENKRRAE